VEVMRKSLLIFCLGFFSLGCSQKEKTAMDNKPQKTYNINDFIFPEAKDITENNYVEKLNSQIKHYQNEPIYYFRINKQNCLVEVYINDVITYDDYELSNVITPTEIGNILKSGQQTVTVKMYPLGNLLNEDLGLENQPPATKLSNKAQVDISVVLMDNKSKQQFADERVITSQKSSKDAAGKEYYEFSFTFNAEVPYEFEGWTKGQDLRKLDQQLVRKKALEFYEMVGQIYVNQDLSVLLKIEYPFVCRAKQSFYRKRENIEKNLEEYSNIKNFEFKINTIKNYKMEFMGNGKVLLLTTNSLEPEFRGGGALMLNYREGNIFQPGIPLFLPEGRDLATQGFMMWK
jgi:hypothetical protein